MPLVDGSKLDDAPVNIGALPEGKMLVPLAEIDGIAEMLKLYGGAVPEGLIVVALAEIEGLADGSYDAAVPIVPITELAEYERDFNDDGKGYGPCVG